MLSESEKTSSPNRVDAGGEPDLIDILDRAIAILRHEGKDVADFDVDLEWLEHRRTIWTEHEWRIALVGITSSGKSTLINALLGERLLPTGVSPTSSINIFCRHSKTLWCRVRYKDKTRTPNEVRGKKDIKQTLARLADESRNPGNKYGIDEIDLFSPHLPFAEDIVLVDTPGLDSYGLLEHEELTLVQLLPSVDMVVFLQTVKSNAGEQIHRILQAVHGEERPLILLVTQADGVEPKRGCNRTIKKTKDEILNEHLKIAEDRLHKAGFPRGSTPIIPVSARRHLDGNHLNSGISFFAKSVEKRVLKLRPQLLDGRFLQLRNELHRLSANNFSLADLNDAHTRVGHRRKQLKENQIFLDDISDHLEDEVNALISVGINILEKLCEEANALKDGSADFEAARTIAEKLKETIHTAGSSLGKAIRQAGSKIRKLGESLNLSVEDMVSSESAMKPIPTIKVRKSARDVDDEGFFGFFLRCFGLGGTHREEFLDAEGFKQEINKYSKDYIWWLRFEARQTILDNVKNHVEPVIEEIRRQHQGLDNEEKSQLDRGIRLRVGEALKALIESIPHPSQLTPHVSYPSASQVEEALYEEIKVPSLVQALNELAVHIMNRRMHDLRTKAMALAAKRAGVEASRRAVIVGFDAHSFERFMNLFWHDFPELELRSEETISNTRVATFFRAFDVPGKRLLPSLDRDIQPASLFETPVTLFLIVDLEQHGSAMNQIFQSEILRYLGMHVGLVLVVQSIKGLSNSGNISQAIHCLHTIKTKFQITVDAVLVNSEEAYFSTVVDSVFQKIESGVTLRDEKQLRHVLQPDGPRQRTILNEALMALRDLSHHNHDS